MPKTTDPKGPKCFTFPPRPLQGIGKKPEGYIQYTSNPCRQIPKILSKHYARQKTQQDFKTGKVQCYRVF